jgi:glycosyltransferase involved in cell wall biosynthesis
MLTIYIPTYNRLESLYSLLEILFNQVEEINCFEDLISIHVSDNCSNDDTSAFLQSVNKSYFKYSVFKKNIGGDKNIKNSINVCQGKYLWILADDDYPMPGVIEFVINALVTEKPKLLYMPAKWSRNPLKYYGKDKSKRKAVKLDAREFVEFVNVKITFISSFIVDIESIKSRGGSSLEALVKGSNFEQFMNLLK